LDSIFYIWALSGDNKLNKKIVYFELFIKEDNILLLILII